MIQDEILMMSVLFMDCSFLLYDSYLDSVKKAASIFPCRPIQLYQYTTIRLEKSLYIFAEAQSQHGIWMQAHDETLEF
jgi:hypothetical protein